MLTYALINIASSAGTAYMLWRLERKLEQLRPPSPPPLVFKRQQPVRPT